MDSGVAVLWHYFRHLYPEFTVTHAVVYKFLIGAGALSAEKLADDTHYSRATVYKVLRELVLKALVKKTSFTPILYSVPDPVKAFDRDARQVKALLDEGRDKIEDLFNKPEKAQAYIVKAGGEQLFDKKTLEPVQDPNVYRELSIKLSQKFEEAEKTKKTQFVAYR